MVDAALNLVLGFLLLFFPPKLVELLAVPRTDHLFYPSMLGAVLAGIGLALLAEYFRRPGGMVGLGVGGSISINLCAGLVLAGWLLSGKLTVPSRGYTVLWVLVVLLLLMSLLEFIAHQKEGASAGILKKSEVLERMKKITGRKDLP